MVGAVHKELIRRKSHPLLARLVPMAKRDHSLQVRQIIQKHTYNDPSICD
jgi:hypothetical protein